MNFTALVYNLGVDVNTLENGDVVNNQVAYITYTSSTAFSNQTQCTIDPTWADADIDAAMADAVRQSAQDSGVTVPENAPVIILNGIGRG